MDRVEWVKKWGLAVSALIDLLAVMSSIDPAEAFDQLRDCSPEHRDFAVIQLADYRKKLPLRERD